MLTLSHEPTTEPFLQIGLIVLQADETIERDMRRLLPERVDLLVSRVSSGTHVTPESLSEMASDLQRAADLFPKSARFGAVGYGCTSGTAEIGADRVAAAIMAGARTPTVTEPVSALTAACRHLHVRRVGLLSPYIESVSVRLRAVLNSNGLPVSAFASFAESKEERVARIAPSSIRDAAIRLADEGEMDALFISCTNLRTLDVIEGIETATGLPVLTSNQVLAWHLLRLADWYEPVSSVGHLFKAPGNSGNSGA